MKRRFATWFALASSGGTRHRGTNGRRSLVLSNRSQLWFKDRDRMTPLADDQDRKWPLSSHRTGRSARFPVMAKASHWPPRHVRVLPICNRVRIGSTAPHVILTAFEAIDMMCDVSVVACDFKMNHLGLRCFHRQQDDSCPEREGATKPQFGSVNGSCANATQLSGDHKSSHIVCRNVCDNKGLVAYV
jgi:hypothetical protein